MNQITSKEQQNSSSETSKKFFTVKKFAIKNHENGTWPNSESAVWALRSGAPQNGFGKAFITVGRRVLVNEEKFWEAVARLQEAKNVSGR